MTPTVKILVGILVGIAMAAIRAAFSGRPTVVTVGCVAIALLCVGAALLTANHRRVRARLCPSAAAATTDESSTASPTAGKTRARVSLSLSAARARRG